MREKKNFMNEEWDIATVRVNPSVIEEYSAQMMDDHPSIKVGVSSVIGTRKYQQDTVFANVDNDVAVGIVCDGMGGLEGGEVASQKATMTFAEDFYAWMNSNEFHEDGVLRFMKDEAVRMDKVITGLKNASGEFLDAGTTVVAAVVFGNRMYWLSVGDSRIYLLRDGKIQKLTRDHNVRLLIDEERKRGIISQDEYERKARNAEGLISYLGIGEVELIDTNEGGVPIVLEENDIIILCSDGVYKRLTDEAVGEIVWCEEPDMERAAKHLTDVVMQYTKNSQDNTSIVLMQYNHYLS